MFVLITIIYTSDIFASIAIHYDSLILKKTAQNAVDNLCVAVKFHVS